MAHRKRARELLRGLPVELAEPDRSRFPLLTEGKLGIGSPFAVKPLLDTVGIAVLVGRDFEVEGGTVQVEKFGTAEQSLTVRHALPGGGFVALGRGDRAWIERSAKGTSGNNVDGLSLDHSLESMREALAEAEQFCEVEKAFSFEQAKVIRIDPVRDFDDVAHLPALLDGLARVSLKDARWKKRRFQNAETNNAETLRVGPKAWGASLYDKYAESPEHADVGRLRYELRLHQDQLQSAWARDCGGVIRLVGDLTEAKIAGLAESGFVRSGFDREVSAMARVATSVMEVDGLEFGERMMLWAYLTMPGASSQMSPKTRRKYRLLCESIGVAPGSIDEVEAAVVVRLNYQSGTEEVRRAA